MRKYTLPLFELKYVNGKSVYQFDRNITCTASGEFDDHTIAYESDDDYEHQFLRVRTEGLAIDQKDLNKIKGKFIFIYV